MPRAKQTQHPWTLALREARRAYSDGNLPIAGVALRMAYGSALHANRTDFHRAHAADAVITDIKRLARVWAVDLEG